MEEFSVGTLIVNGNELGSLVGVDRDERRRDHEFPTAVWRSEMEAAFSFHWLSRALVKTTCRSMPRSIGLVLEICSRSSPIEQQRAAHFRYAVGYLRPDKDDRNSGCDELAAPICALDQAGLAANRLKVWLRGRRSTDLTSTSKTSMFVWARVTSSPVAISTRRPRRSTFRATPRTFSLARLAALANRPGFPAVTGVAELHGPGLRKSFGRRISLPIRSRSTVKVATSLINGRPAGTVALAGRTENQQLNITLTYRRCLDHRRSSRRNINLASPGLADQCRNNIHKRRSDQPVSDRVARQRGTNFRSRQRNDQSRGQPARRRRELFTRRIVRRGKLH